MRPSSSTSEPFAFLVAVGAVTERTGQVAWLQAMLDVEAALAESQAELDLIPAEAAAQIKVACRADQFDVDAVFDAASLSGNPAVPLVDALRAAVGAQAGAHVHAGATSQDVMDTATMLVAARCAEHVSGRLTDLASDLERLAADHASTAMVGRTLLQHALPTSFGAVASSWADAVLAGVGALDCVALAVQLGGPVGDATSFGARAGEVTAGVARRLGLEVPPRPWHAQRTPVTQLAGAWGSVAGAAGGVATDIVLLASSDIAELHEVADGAGGSSSMAHKRNPVAAVSARAAAAQAPGLVATVLHAAGGHELQRAAGAWHAEWPALQSLLRCTGAAVEWLAASVERLVVDPDRMASNLDAANIPQEARRP